MGMQQGMSVNSGPPTQRWSNYTRIKQQGPVVRKAFSLTHGGYVENIDQVCTFME